MKSLLDIIKEELAKANNENTETIEVDKVYKTRNGSAVTILHIFDDWAFPVLGAIANHDGAWSLDFWSLDGLHSTDGNVDPLDLLLTGPTPDNEYEFEDDEPVWFKMSETGQVFKGHYANVDNSSNKHCVYVKGTKWMSNEAYMEVYAVMKATEVPF